MLLFAFVQKPVLSPFCPPLTSVPSLPSPPPLQTCLGFEKSLDFISADALM